MFKSFYILVVLLSVFHISALSQGGSQEIWNTCIEQFENKNYNEAISFSQELLKGDLPKDIKQEVYLLQGDSYFSLKKYKKAITSFEEAFKLADDIDRLTIAEDIAFAYANLEKNKKAIKWYHTQYDIANELNKPKTAIEAKINSAQLFSNYGDYESSKKDIDVASNLSSKNNDYKIVEINKIINVIDNNIKSTDDVITEFEKEKEAEEEAFLDSVLLQKAKSISEIEKLSEKMQLIEYKIKAQADEYEKKLLNEQLKTLEKEKELLQNEAKLELTNAKLKVTDANLREEQALGEKKQAQIIGGLIALGLLLLLAIILLILYRFKQKTNTTLTRINKEIAHQKDVIEEKAHQIDSSIQYSKKIQQSILPTFHSFKSVLNNSFIYFNPKEEVSGDFYWHYKTDKYTYGAAVDCTGHGVPGAFMTMVCKQILDDIVKEHQTLLPSEILELSANKLTYQFSKHSKDEQAIIKDGMDISLFRLDLRFNTLIHSGARNPLYLIRDNKLIEYKGTRRSVGYADIDNLSIVPFKDNELQIITGDRIFMTSDGFPDQRGGHNNKKYYYKPFRELILKTSALTLDEQKEALEKEFESWKNTNEQLDDVLIVAVEF